MSQKGCRYCVSKKFSGWSGLGLNRSLNLMVNIHKVPKETWTEICSPSTDSLNFLMRRQTVGLPLMPGLDTGQKLGGWGGVHWAKCCIIVNTGQHKVLLLPFEHGQNTDNKMFCWCFTKDKTVDSSILSNCSNFIDPSAISVGAPELLSCARPLARARCR